MQKKYGPKGFTILALSNESDDKVKPYVAKNADLKKLIVGSGSAKTNEAFAIRGFPSAVIIDPKGKIAWAGHPGKPEAEETIQRILKEDPPEGGNVLLKNAGKSEYNAAVRLLKKKQYAKALKGYEQVAKEFKGTKYGKKAKARVKKLKGDKKFMAKVNAAEMGKKCKGWLDSARMMAKAGKTDKAAEYYKRILDKYPKSKYAKTAEKEMKEL